MFLGYNYRIMLKSMAIVAVTVVFAIGMSGQPHETPKDKTAISGNRQPSVVSNDSHDRYTYAQEAPAKPKDEPFSWNAAVKRPDWWLVLVAAITGALIFWQAWETRTAAEAALLQAKHLANSERAWIMANPGVIPDDFEPNPSIVQIMEVYPPITNCGKTMGRIIEGSIKTHAVVHSSELPPEPQYDDILEFNIFIPQETTVQPLRTPIRLGDFIDYRGKRSILYIYGRIIYLDFAEKRRETRFCFEYVVPGGFSGMKRGFYHSVSAPRSYTECT
jgi:hypothetical protein